MSTDPTALPGWRWMAGMRSKNGVRIIGVLPDLIIGTVEGSGEVTKWTPTGTVTYTTEGIIRTAPGDVVTAPPDEPDPTDPATGGCLLHLLGTDVAVTIIARETGPLYRIGYGLDGRRHATTSHDTLGAACIAVAVAMGRWPGGGA